MRDATRSRDLPARRARLALRHRYRITVLAAHGDKARLRPAVRHPDLRRPWDVSQPRRRVARRPGRGLHRGGFVPGAGLLCMMPSGPDGVGHFDRVVAERLGSTCYAIDLDPRWVKKVAARSDRRAAAVVTDYVDHVLEQARHILESQRVGNLHATPPLLEAIANNDHFLGLVNRRIRYILLSGAHVDVDTMDLFRGIFPDSAIAIAFGNTMILSQAATRTDGESIVFDPRSPYVVIWVIDPATGERVPYGERGQVVMHHLSKGMFIPGNLERDTAIRRPG